MSARKALAIALRAAPSLPKKDYDVKDVADLPDNIRKTTIVIERDGYTPGPNAIGTLFAKFKVIVARPESDIDKAEDGLDIDVPNVLEALQIYLGATWTGTSPVIVKDKYRGESIACSIPTNRPY
jgi:hypothetical protein